ncbi:putative glycine cleavage system H protein, mitochondrial precursor [Circinella umbellata]|nr:putative glycine cleavage system H protein, mitochondrial precursor [Circinella umbellata]
MFLKTAFRHAATTYSRQQYISRNSMFKMTNSFKAGSIHRSQFSTSQVLMARTLYTKDHEWLTLDGQGFGVLGITDYAQKALGDVVYVETPIVGDSVKKNQQMGAIESVKAASDIYSPVSGEIVNVNEQLTDYPALINKDPENEGWFVKIRLENHDEVEDLMDDLEYAAYCDDSENDA